MPTLVPLETVLCFACVKTKECSVRVLLDENSVQAYGVILGAFVVESNRVEECFRVSFFPGSKRDPRPHAEERAKHCGDTIDGVDYCARLTRR